MYELALKSRVRLTIERLHHEYPRVALARRRDRLGLLGRLDRDVLLQSASLRRDACAGLTNRLEIRNRCQQGQTPDCMQGISNKTDATMGMLLGAKIACDAGDDAAARDLAKAIRDLWLPKIIRQLSPAGAQAAVWNTWPVFRNTDWVDLDVTLPMTADGCSTMAVVIVGNQVVTPDATGGAAEEEAAQSPGGTPGEETVAVVIPSGSPSAALACTYRVPSESQFSVRFGDPRESMDLSGTIKVA